MQQLKPQEIRTISGGTNSEPHCIGHLVGSIYRESILAMFSPGYLVARTVKFIIENQK